MRTMAHSSPMMAHGAGKRVIQAATWRGGLAAGSSGRRGASETREVACCAHRVASAKESVSGLGGYAEDWLKVDHGVEKRNRRKRIRRICCYARSGNGDRSVCSAETEFKRGSRPSRMGRRDVGSAAGSDGVMEEPGSSRRAGEDSAFDEESTTRQKPKTTVKFKIVRVFSGLVAGGIGALVTFTGGLVFSAFVCVMAAQISREYSRMISSLDTKLLNGDTAHVPMAVTNVLPLLNVAMVLTEVFHWAPLDCSFIVSSFIVLSLLLVQREVPALLEHASFGVFGIFYCGFLPTFWLKLRNLAVLAPHSALMDMWPVRAVQQHHVANFSTPRLLQRDCDHPGSTLTVSLSRTRARERSHAMPAAES